ncbi:MAG TPA: type I DNA topoisomerase [Bacteroidetes bacterium]|nr:type I DNA topoisomerase [Bacteroidota bacterium]
MAKNLVIVESPAKAKTIEGFLGSEFTVKSCYGHIRDLAKENNGVDIENGFKPIYEVPDDKKQVVSELKKLAKQAETVWLASDEDREGEAISWHLAEVLNLDHAKTKRIVFHEITKPAILKAIANPRIINQNLVNAQQARRILDRIVGFELSPVLWKKVKPSLSAGRVQSVAVRLIVEREREITDFNSDSSFRVIALFHDKKTNKQVKAELPKRFKTEKEAMAFLESCIGTGFHVDKVETKPGKRTPAAPFTTSTLQQEASRKLGFSVAQTMSVAQRLYEAGHITYMRTDSVNLSELALDTARAEIEKAYGKEFSKTRKYTTKTASAQEAHEAIRPTYFDKHTIPADGSEKRLYDLIWKRSIASQMSDAVLEKTVVHIAIDNAKTTDKEFLASGEVIKFEGFLKVYLEGTDEEEDDTEEGLLPDVKAGDVLDLERITATEKFSRAAPRYTEASLVKKLEELGIGRPSTYAPTISTIQKRGYVVKEDRPGKERKYEELTLVSGQINKNTLTENTGAEKSKLFPTDIGSLVNDFLIEHFDGIMDYSFTANVEKEFDEIAEGLKSWTTMLSSFYGPFHKTVDQTLDEAKRVTGERQIGLDPESGKPISVRMGRYGPFAQIGIQDEEEKPRYASLRAGQSMETLTLEEALDLFKMPRIIGEYEGAELKVAIGRFGPYVQHQKAFYSIPKEDDPYQINEERAIEIIIAKRKADIEKLIKVYDEDSDLQLLNGRWGPYLKKGKDNYKIPKARHENAATITYEEAKEMMEKSAAAPAGKKKGRGRK